MNYQDAIERIRYNLNIAEEYLFDSWNVELTDDQIRTVRKIVGEIIDFFDVEEDDDC